MEELKIIEHQNQRVLLTSQLAESYGTDNKAISYNFNHNKERYLEGKHYYLLQGNSLRAFREIHDLPSNLNKVYLWTERGAFLHAKLLNTDKAWEVYDSLFEHYFRTRAVRSKIDSYMTEDPIKRAERWIEEEKERQQLRSENKALLNEVIHKEDVIIGLVDDISKELVQEMYELNNINNGVALCLTQKSNVDIVEN